MNSQLPNCEDFIIAAIRTIRVSPSNMKGGTSAGVSLRRLWNVASEVYKENDFRQALNELLSSGELIATWKISRYGPENSPGPFSVALTTEVPEIMNLGGYCLYRDLNGNALERGQQNTTEHDYIYNVKLYVATDGLPVSLKKKSQKTVGARATQIIEAMNKKE